MDNEIMKPAAQPIELTPSQRFTTKVMQLYQDGKTQEIAVSESQKRLIQGYFVAIDATIKKAEEKRKKAYKPDPLPIEWRNINMDALAETAVQIARLGLDSYQKNHINFIPYHDKTMNCYTIGFIEGYVGLEYKAKRYALDMPIDIITELIYSNDTFRAIKKDKDNRIENYEFIQGDIFDLSRTVRGGFYYYVYGDPTKNKLHTMTLAQITKRKPKYASADFWGGEKDVYENNKKTGTKEEIEGWFDEMCIKTIKRAAYNGIPLDPQKIDNNYQWLKQKEQQFLDAGLDAEIESMSNNNPIDVTPTDTNVDYDTGEINFEKIGPQGPTGPQGLHGIEVDHNKQPAPIDVQTETTTETTTEAEPVPQTSAGVTLDFD